MINLTLAAGPYDRTEALRDGRVRVEGVDLTYVPLSPEEIFWRQLRYEEFDVSELSLSKYILLRSQGDRRFVALPVFPSRSFRHRNVFIHRRSGIRRPEDLRGKRIGLPEYSMTAAVWVRGFLEDDHGVKATDVTWVQGGQESAGRKEATPLGDLAMALGITVEHEGERTLSEMLAQGAIDALITAKTPSCYGSPHVGRLFEDYRAAEEDYYRRTGLFPIMHCVVLRRAVYDAHPWVAQSLMKAFFEAKRAAMDRLREVGALSVSLPWLPAEVERLEALFGPDWWPYGIEANRAGIEALMRYQTAQGLIAAPLPVEDLFAPNSLTSFKL